MIRLLKEPFPLEKNRRSIILRLFITGGLMYLILLVFKPFGLKEHHGMDLFVYSGGFVIIGLVYLTCHFLFIEPLFNEDKWNIGKEVLNNLLILFVLGLINALYYSIYEGDTISYMIIIAFILYTLFIGIFPVIIILILRQNSLMKYHIKVAESIHTDQIKINKDSNNDCTVELFSKNPEKKVNCDCSDLILLQAQDNYIGMHYKAGSQIKKELIRNTMKQCTLDVKHLPMFFRCHRSFIINLDKIESVEGNAQGLKVKLESIDEKIPVSRHLVKEFRSRMMHFTT